MLRKSTCINLRKINHAVEDLIEFDAFNKELMEMEDFVDEFKPHLVETKKKPKINDENEYWENKIHFFITLLWDMNPDELMYSLENNVFKFNQNDIHDHQLLLFLKQEIQKRREIEDELLNAIENGTLMSLFYGWGDSLERSKKATKYKDLILNCDMKDLTGDGLKLLEFFNHNSKEYEDYISSLLKPKHDNKGSNNIVKLSNRRK